MGKCNFALQASTSKTPYPAGVSAVASSPHQYPSYLCNVSPHPTTAAAVIASTLAGVQPQHDSSQQQAPQAATASESAADAHQFEAQWEAKSMNAAQTASRLSLLQAEHTQVELELAEAAQQTAAETAATGLSRHCQQDTAAAPAAADEDAVSHHPSEICRVESVEQQEQPVTSGRKSEGQYEATAAQVTQSEPVRPIQSHRAGSRRLTRGSARASCASQSSASDAVSTADGGRRGKRQNQAVTNLAVVTEHSETDMAADAAVSTAEMHGQQALVSQAAAESAAEEEADPSGSQQQPAVDAELTTMPEEMKERSAAPADLTVPEEGPQQTNVSSHSGMHKGEADLAFGCDAQAAAAAASQGAAMQTQQEGPAQPCVRADASGAAPNAPDRALPDASVTMSIGAAAEDTEQLHSRSAEGVDCAAESQQGRKGKGRAKRPPKPKQPAKKKQNRKRGRLPAGHDENADVNKVCASEHAHVCNSDIAAAKGQQSHDVALDCPASPVHVMSQKEAEAKDEDISAGKREGSSKPIR